jgi:hypothetical protein
MVRCVEVTGPAGPVGHVSWFGALAEPGSASGRRARRSGGLFISGKEDKSDDCLERFLVFADRRPAAAAFFGEHPPGLQVRDGVLGGGADFRQGGLKAACDSAGFPPGGVRNGTIVMPFTPV